VAVLTVFHTLSDQRFFYIPSFREQLCLLRPVQDRPSLLSTRNQLSTLGEAIQAFGPTVSTSTFALTLLSLNS
jgi:hypothetical protein